MYLLGYDIGSSSIKATVIDAGNGAVIASAASPDTELDIIALRTGWAEQHPQTWWEHTRNVTRRILSGASIDPGDIAAIGISYQMHGLVLVDERHTVLRSSIIWCDSRAVDYGARAFDEMGTQYCLEHFLNSPGNFTASKLKWVKEHEPDIFARIHKFMLPGDYIAMMMTGDIQTTPSGLSEGILWDFPAGETASSLLEYYGIPGDLIPEVTPTFSVQGHMTGEAAGYLGLASGIPVAYRAGDQPNNALSLKVLDPGEIAATAGTSGVVYGVLDSPSYDPESRVNPFVHVSHHVDSPRYGVLMCINGTGILNSWIKHQALRDGLPYTRMNDLAAAVPPGADGLLVIPYGNGAERTLGNRNIGASLHNLQFNTHTTGHLVRASQEGIVFAFEYGLEIMRGMGVTVDTVRAGNTNMFLSPVFREAFATLTGAAVELYNTDGSQGAARGAGIGAGIFADSREAFAGLISVMTVEPNPAHAAAYRDAYEHWLAMVQRISQGVG